jgi:glycosyltransferase involved in cell wall biosynthesis
MHRPAAEPEAGPSPVERPPPPVNAARSVVFWGTYDVGKPRVRLLLEGARHAGIEVLECHAHVWGGVEDKSQLGLAGRLGRLLRWLAAYPRLIWRYLWLPSHDAVIVPYLGQLDVLVLWPFARLRRTRVLWDAFLSLYDTVVDDRRLAGRRSPIAAALYGLEWLACRAADRVFLDTRAHAIYFERTFRLAEGSVGRVFVGAESSAFPRSGPARSQQQPFTVLFYGQFIPLHGVDTILRAAAIVQQQREPVRWLLVGTGQQAAAADELMAELGLQCVERVTWIPYPELVQWMRRADVCLGIFGTSEKASRVIPNKVYQILAAGRPLITADTPGIRELLQPSGAVRLVPPGQPEALATAVLELKQAGPIQGAAPGQPVVDAGEVGRQLAELLETVVPR